MHADRLTLTDLRSVKNKTWKARSKWQDIGLELKLEKTDLDTIRKKHGSDADVCFEEMLSMWLKQTESRPTWSKMIRALKTPAVGYQELAEHIENSIAKPSIESLQFPRNNNVMMKPDEEELDGMLRERTRDIILEFNVLKQKLLNTLEHCSYKKLAEYLEDYCIDNLESFDDMRNFIKSKSSFYDYEIVKYIICLAGAESDKQRLQKYEEHLEDYAKDRVQYESPSTSPVSLDSQSSKLCIRLDSEYDKLQCNPDKLKLFQCRLYNLMKIPVL